MRTPVNLPTATAALASLVLGLGSPAFAEDRDVELRLYPAELTGFFLRAAQQANRVGDFVPPGSGGFQSSAILTPNVNTTWLNIPSNEEGIIQRLEVEVIVDHPRPEDLEIRLQGPNGGNAPNQRLGAVLKRVGDAEIKSTYVIDDAVGLLWTGGVQVTVTDRVGGPPLPDSAGLSYGVIRGVNIRATVSDAGLPTPSVGAQPGTGAQPTSGDDAQPAPGATRQVEVDMFESHTIPGGLSALGGFLGLTQQELKIGDFSPSGSPGAFPAPANAGLKSYQEADITIPHDQTGRIRAIEIEVDVDHPRGTDLEIILRGPNEVGGTILKRVGEELKTIYPLEAAIGKRWKGGFKVTVRDKVKGPEVTDPLTGQPLVAARHRHGKRSLGYLMMFRVRATLDIPVSESSLSDTHAQLDPAEATRLSRQAATQISKDKETTLAINVVGRQGEIADLKLGLDYAHPMPNGMSLTVVSPAGTEVNADLPYPTQYGWRSLSRVLRGFEGEDPNGTWTLKVSTKPGTPDTFQDPRRNDTPRAIANWALTMTTVPQAQAAGVMTVPASAPSGQ